MEIIETPDECLAFALCDRAPTTLIDHPTGPIPVCDRCLDKLIRLSDNRVVVLAVREIQ